MLEKPQIIWYFAHLFVPLHPIYKKIDRRRVLQKWFLLC